MITIYASPTGAKLRICERCEKDLLARDEWPKDHKGVEYCQVYSGRGKGLGNCEICSPYNGVQIAEYSREDGYIKYHGVRKWDSVEQWLSFHFPDPEFWGESETEELLGWPDEKVTWYGHIGYATQA